MINEGWGGPPGLRGFSRTRSTALFILCATAIALPAQTFTTLHSFDNTDGASPYAALVQATDGNLYGTTVYGGADGFGTIFNITPAGTLTTLHSFCSESNCTDGSEPFTGLAQAANGNFYGTTRNGGIGGTYGFGTVFRITPSGALTTLHNFCSQSCMDGESPLAGLIQATNGDYYGTTYSGGIGIGNGTVFKITPSGTLTTLYSFCAQSACPDGAGPTAGLVQATNGDFYGATDNGGAYGLGTVFKITPGGVLATLHSFCPDSLCADGQHPQAALVQAGNGELYGTTYEGGAGAAGTVFKITPSGTLTTIHTFCATFPCTDGLFPAAALVRATDGNLYGTTVHGGANNDGTIFKITPGGTLTTLYSFCSQSACADGSQPYAGIVQDTNGKFYGTASSGGATNDGAVFSLSVGLHPFVETQPASGKVGTAVNILGTDLTGATRVTFNGISAAFTVVSASEITTAVPAGAATGTVQVITPRGALSSNISFRVR